MQGEIISKSNEEMGNAVMDDNTVFHEAEMM